MKDAWAKTARVKFCFVSHTHTATHTKKEKKQFMWVVFSGVCVCRMLDHDVPKNINWCCKWRNINNKKNAHTHTQKNLKSFYFIIQCSPDITTLETHKVYPSLVHAFSYSMDTKNEISYIFIQHGTKSSVNQNSFDLQSH